MLDERQEMAKEHILVGQKAIGLRAAKKEDTLVNKDKVASVENRVDEEPRSGLALVLTEGRRNVHPQHLEPIEIYGILSLIGVQSPPERDLRACGFQQPSSS